jgi:hypothetical protein
MLDMSMKQKTDKMVVYPDSSLNYDIVGDSSSNDELDEIQKMALRLEKAKYLFFNLVFRDQDDIDRVRAIKII